MRRFVHVPLAALFLFVGTMHFVQPAFFLPLMPGWLPRHAELVALSGVAELVSGVALLVPAWRVYGAWLAFATLLAVWPANWHHALSGGISHPDLPPQMADATIAWVRLPMQIPLLLWAWWIAHHASAPVTTKRASRPVALLG